MFPSPGDLPDPGIEPESPASPALAGGVFATGPPRKLHKGYKPRSDLCLVTQSCPALCDPMDCSPPGSSVHGDSPGKNTRMSCHVLLQGIFPIQRSNTGLLHCRQILYHLSHQGSPRILQWIAYPFSRGSSKPRNQRSPALQTDSLPAELPGKNIYTLI